MRPGIRIERVPYEEPYHVELHYQVSNGRQSWSFFYYDNARVLNTFAEKLIGFPHHPGEVFSYEVGSECPEDRFAYYFGFRAFELDSTGHCALQFRFNNGERPPENEVFEFCLRAIPVQLDTLGLLYREFAKLNHRVLDWSLDEGFLE